MNKVLTGLAAGLSITFLASGALAQGNPGNHNADGKSFGSAVSGAATKGPGSRSVGESVPGANDGTSLSGHASGGRNDSSRGGENGRSGAGGAGNSNGQGTGSSQE